MFLGAKGASQSFSVNSMGLEEVPGLLEDGSLISCYVTLDEMWTGLCGSWNLVLVFNELL